MSFLSTVEAKINRALGNAIKDPTEASKQAELAAERSAAIPPPMPTVISAPASIVTAPAPTEAIRVLPKIDDASRRRATAASGQSGIRVPPVGVRGVGAVPRTTILGR